MSAQALRSKPFLTGLVFVAIGGFALIVDSQYKVGSATDMQPGFFPGMLAIILVLLGVGSIGVGLFSAAPELVARPNIVPLVFLMVGMVVFALVLEPSGLVPATVLLVLIGCYNRLRRNLLEVLAIAAVLAILSTGIFIYALQLPLSAF